MFKISEEVYSFKFMESQRDGYVHLVVIRSWMGYESWCRAVSTYWFPAKDEVTCPNCLRTTVERVIQIEPESTNED